MIGVDVTTTGRVGEEPVGGGVGGRPDGGVVGGGGVAYV